MIAVITALMVFVLLGITALSFDLGRIWNLDTELQNAADSAALACASQLDGSAGAMNRGIQAATGGLVQNSQTFATDGAGAAVTISGSDITFYSDYKAGTLATSDADANYCKVTVAPRTVSFSFAAAIGAVTSASSTASAVAELGTAKCQVPPMMICNPNEPLGLPFDAANHIGEGITLKASQGQTLAPGNFGLLALNNQNLSTNDVRDAWARVHPLAQCFGNQVTTKPGQATAIAQGLNMRFDVYALATHQVPPGEPPVRQNPEYVPAQNTVKGLVRTGANPNCALSNNGWKNPTQVYVGTNPPPPTAMGFPRDACAYNNGSCDVYGGGSFFGDGVWDSATYMQLNHPGVTMAQVDLNADGSVTRHEVYQWELANQLAQAEPEDHPVCNTQAPASGPDRRVITVAVVNCASVNGTQSVTPQEWVELFLTEPMGVFNGNNDLYGEVVGPANPQDKTVTKYVLQLVE